MFSICVLCYGSYTELAYRCLLSIADAYPEFSTYVKDVRIGLNSVCEDTDRFVRAWANSVVAVYSIPVHFVAPVWPEGVPAYKYPTMRKMFRFPGAPLADRVMWFDDDSFLGGYRGSWWSSVEKRTAGSVAGEIQVLDKKPRQQAWIERQPWYTGKGSPERFMFVQGGWWVAPSDFILNNDWPWPELRHCGGDSMFGELCLQRNMPMTPFYSGVHINANAAGVNSAAKRRGYSEDVFASSDAPPGPIFDHVRIWSVLP